MLMVKVTFQQSLGLSQAVSHIMLWGYFPLIAVGLKPVPFLLLSQHKMFPQALLEDLELLFFQV